MKIPRQVDERVSVRTMCAVKDVFQTSSREETKIWTLPLDAMPLTSASDGSQR